MELILLIIAAIALLYFYNTLKEYLKNPLKPAPKQNNSLEYDLSNDPYVSQADPFEKFKQSQAGVFLRLLNHLEPQKNMLDSSLRTLFIDEVKQPLSAEEQTLATQLLNKETESLELLCQEISNHAHGEYPKKVRLVEFLLLLAYADGNLDSKEKDMLIDVAAFLKIDNQDFNQLYDNFERFNQIEIPMTLEEAKTLFELQEESSLENLEQKALNLVSPYYHKATNYKHYTEEDFISLRKIALASILVNQEQS
ncbi:TerB family tellurite resistance protein [Helicobacter cetorum]|uniref:TerB family tellurite resistance protein n=1 Tax=Helicobacter cetorum TaxID=138563 RepID=UPI000CF18948|nr:TerB family tellurite resistance protein [Helicobacter cetorum]